MKEIFYIEDTPANKISYYLLLVFAVTLPFDRIYSELSLIGLLVHTLLHIGAPATGDVEGGAGVGGVRRFSWRWEGWLISCLFLLMVLGTLYAPRFGDASRQLEKQLALLLFPLIAWFSRLDWKKVQGPLLKGFALSCLFTVIYLYGCAFMSIRNQELSLDALLTPPFMNHAFSAPIDLHATYFSLYVGIAVVVFVGLAFKSKSALSRGLYMLAVLVLLGGLLQLAARAVFLGMLVVVNIILPLFLLRGRARWMVLGGFLLLSGVSLVFVTTNKALNSRYLVQLKEDMQQGRGDADVPEPRMLRWACAWELIRARPLIGYGTGAEVPRLKEKYYAHQLTISYTHEFNAHNQYLSYLLMTGLPGLLLYLGVLVMGTVLAFRRKDVLLLSFLVLLVFVSFSENILDSNKGIFFFSYFFTLFLYPVPAVGSVFGSADHISVLRLKRKKGRPHYA